MPTPAASGDDMGVRALRRLLGLFAVRLEPASQPRYRDTALSDTKAIFKHWATVGAVATMTLAAAIVLVLESKLSLLLKVILTAVGAGVGGLVILGPLIFCASLAVAPHRQRNEARREVQRLEEPDATLFDDYDAFIVAAKAQKPRLPRMDIFNREHLLRSQSEYNAAEQGWWGETVGDYHSRFRARALVALRGTPYAAMASAPGGLDDLWRIRRALQDIDRRHRYNITQPAPPPGPGSERSSAGTGS